MYAAAPLCCVLLLAGCGGKPKDEVRTFSMGEKVELGHLIYTVYETQWLTQIKQDPTPRIPQNRFLLVRVSIVNTGGGSILSPHLTIQDDRGNTYQEVANGEGVPQWIGYLRQVQPAEAAQGNMVFDAPPAHYQLRLTDEDESKVALVDMPLTFGAENPELPTPGATRPTDEIPPGALKK
jgi:hypothetical protein